MSTHPNVDTYIATKTAEIEEQYESILTLIEENWEKHEAITNNISECLISKLKENGFIIKLYCYNPSFYQILW